MKKSLKILVQTACLIMLVFSFSFISEISAVTLIVTKTADTNDSVCDADCSLREAIAVAASGDEIQFASPLFDSPQTINITINLIITRPLTITGKGANLLTISNISPRNNSSNAFTIFGGPVNLSGMTIRDCVVSGSFARGGGIFNNGGILNITNSAIIGNSLDSVFSNGINVGGGIYNNGTMTITNSTICGNHANSSGSGNPSNSGGGIANSGNLTLINSTVCQNYTAGTGNTSNFGAGIANGNTLTLINSTITGNSAAGLNVRGGGIDNTGTVNSINTIIAGNIDSTDFSGTLNSQGYNLIGNTNGTTIIGNTVGNILNTDAHLAPLGFYGGTMTYALLSDSPAILLTVIN